MIFHTVYIETQSPLGWTIEAVITAPNTLVLEPPYGEAATKLEPKRNDTFNSRSLNWRLNLAHWKDGLDQYSSVFGYTCLDDGRIQIDGYVTTTWQQVIDAVTSFTKRHVFADCRANIFEVDPRSSIIS